MIGLDCLAVLAGAVPVKAIGAATFGTSVMLYCRTVSEDAQPEDVNQFRDVTNEREHAPRIAQWSQS